MAFGEGWTLRIGDPTGPDRIVRAASHKIVHVGPTWGSTMGWYRHNGTPLREPHVTRMPVSAEETCPASAGALFLIAAEFGRHCYSRVPKIVFVSPAARRLVHGVTWSQNSAALHVYFLRHHITVNCTLKTCCYQLQVTP
jgi:hypothetical protein